MKTLARSLALSLAVVAVGSVSAQSPARQAVSLKNSRVVDASAVAVLSADGTHGPWKLVGTSAQDIRNAAGDVAAFDGLGTNVNALPGSGWFANAYGATSGNLFFPDDYKTAMVLNDTTLAPNTGYRSASLIIVSVLWNPAGTATASGSEDLILQIRNVAGIGTNDASPAFGTSYPGISARFNALPAGVSILRINLSGSGIGLPLGATTGNGLHVIARKPAGSSTAPLTSEAFQLGFSNMASPGDPQFPGTNPSSSDKFTWVDDTNGTSFINNTPNYVFDNLSSTASLSFPYAERYDQDSTPSGYGILQPAIGVFHLASVRKITGKLLFNDLSDPGTLPTNQATFTLQAGTTVSTQTVFLQPDGSFELIDPVPAGGVRTISTKLSHWLRKNVTVNTSAGSANAGVVSLVNGDVDGDNTVSILDYIKLSTSYDLDSSSPSWLIPDGDGIAPKNSDLDEDGSVSILDYIVLSSSYEAEGDNSL